MPTYKTGDYGDNAGFCVLHPGTFKCGDDFEPEVYEYTIEADLGNKVRHGRFGYLLLEAYDVHYKHNKVFVNDKEVGTLKTHGDKDWHTDSFRIPTDAIKKGKNIVKFISRNNTGGMTGNIDDIKIRHPVLLYALE